MKRKPAVLLQAQTNMVASGYLQPHNTDPQHSKSDNYGPRKHDRSSWIWLTTKFSSQWLKNRKFVFLREIEVYWYLKVGILIPYGVWHETYQQITNTVKKSSHTESQYKSLLKIIIIKPSLAVEKKHFYHNNYAKLDRSWNYSFWICFYYSSCKIYML